MKKQTSGQNSNILNDPDKRKKFKSAIVTITHYFDAIDAQKESIKETVDAISEEYGIDKKLVRKLATTMYKSNYASLQEENRHFELLYETIFEGKKVASDPLDEADEENVDEDDDQE